jgi:magnesium transporter
MISNRILSEVRENIDAVIEHDTTLGKELWDQLLQLHPADIASLCSDISRKHCKNLFMMLPRKVKLEVFEELTDTLKAYMLSIVDEKEQTILLESLSLDELTDFMDDLSDEDLEKYLSLLRKKNREKVISLLQFSSESAGGIMDVNVVTLMKDLTVEKSIKLLQRIKPDQEVHRTLYVTDKNNHLIGHVRLEDLVVKSPKDKLADIIHPNELVIRVDEDQEEVAKKMMHYGLTNVPVVGDKNFFLGAIPSQTLIDIIEEEASEDVYRISAMAPIKRTYFETPFLRLIYERSYILVILLLIESFASTILDAYQDTLPRFLLAFVTMLVSTGGNTSSQTSALAIQGLASGEVTMANAWRFFRREISMALVIAAVLGVASFLRVWLTGISIVPSLVVSLTLGLIVMTSVILGSAIPLALNKMKIDPAFSAGPLLATIMDILGIFIFAYLTKMVLFT